MTSAEMLPLEAPLEIDLTDQEPTALVPRVWSQTPIIVVGIVDENEMFALGVRTCLAESPLVRVAPVIDEDVDVVIVSPRIAGERRFPAPLVICGEPPKRVAPGNEVMAVLGRATLTPDHLVASIHAAAAGLRVVHEQHTAQPRLAGRGLEVLALLASGADTKEIAEQLGYSDRTIKSVIRDVQQLLGVKNRVQAVAEGIRQGLI